MVNLTFTVSLFPFLDVSGDWQSPLPSPASGLSCEQPLPQADEELPASNLRISPPWTLITPKTPQVPGAKCVCQKSKDRNRISIHHRRKDLSQKTDHLDFLNVAVTLLWAEEMCIEYS